MNKMKRATYMCFCTYPKLFKNCTGFLTELLVNPGTLQLEKNLLALECLTIRGSMASPSFCTVWIKIFILILINQTVFLVIYTAIFVTHNNVLNKSDLISSMGRFLRTDKKQLTLVGLFQEFWQASGQRPRYMQTCSSYVSSDTLALVEQPNSFTESRFIWVGQMQMAIFSATSQSL